MKKLVIIFIEFALIIGIVIGIYVANLSKKVDYAYHYKKPLMRTQLDLSDPGLKEELVFFLAKELGLYEGRFQILNAVFLYTSDISGADYILVTLKAPDGRLCQITISRNFLPWAQWGLNPKTFNLIEPLTPILESTVEVPRWMQDLGVEAWQLRKYYEEHPEVVQREESAFLDEETGEYKLPSDWYQTTFTLITQEDKIMRLIPDTNEEIKTDMVNSYWKSDYPTEYLGLGYRGYLYRKIEQGR